MDRNRPVVELTEFGGEVMRGLAAIPGELPIPAALQWKLRTQGLGGVGNSLPTETAPEAAPSSSTEPLEGDGAGFGKRFQDGGSLAETSSVPLDAPDPEILESLKRWRSEIADEAGVPPHYILNNATLTELARLRPANPEALLTVKGIGPVKAERYGHTLLEIIGEAPTEERGERGRIGDWKTGRVRIVRRLPISPSPNLPLSQSSSLRPLDPASALGRLHGGRVHGDSRPDARGRVGTRPAGRARM